MEKVALGHAGFDVTRLCLGTWNFASGPGWGPDDERTAVALIHRALDRGVNFLDTARGYGRGESERIVGKAVKGRRDQVVIATKAMQGNAERTAREVERSLECLDTDYVDLYICHWPNRRYPLEAFFEELLRQKEAGRIRAIGVSNFDLEQMNAAVRYGAVSLQPPFSILWRPPHGVLDFCRENDLAVTPYSPLAQGILAGRFTRQKAEIAGVRRTNQLLSDAHRDATLGVARQVDAIADEMGCTSSQVALAWLLQTPGTIIPIVGASRIEQLDENLAALDITLSEAHYRVLDEAGRAVWETVGTGETMWGWRPD